MKGGAVVAALALVCFSAGCQCGPDLPIPDASVSDDAGTFRKDSGITIVTIDPELMNWPSVYASEPCPPETFAAAVDAGIRGNADGGLTFGICIVLKTLTADVVLDSVPETKPVITQFVGGGFRSELTRTPDSRGVMQVRVMRSRYDYVQHQPGGVWPYFEGFLNHGFADMTQDLRRRFEAKSHLLRGAVRFGGLPFTPSNFPQDVWFDGYGTPNWQMSRVTSNGGAYELRMLEGVFGLFLSTPATSLFGTELLQFPVTPTFNIDFNRDQEFDVDLPTSLLEGTLTVDGEPLPDARPGTDFAIRYTRPGDADPTIASRHEGGLPAFTALIPKGQYGATLDFDGLPNRTMPTRIFGKPLVTNVDLRNDATFNVDLSTVSVEGAIVIDGQPARPNPNYNFQLYMIGAAGATSGNSFLAYEIPLDSSSFRIRAFPSMYVVLLSLDDGLADNLATGFWVVDRYYMLQAPRSMSVSIDTAHFRGKLIIDGQVPVPGRRVGTFDFRNRALTGQYSWFSKGVIPDEDGSFDVKLPKGEYEVYFTIDPETYPDYASGRRQLFPRVPLDQDQTFDVDYRTVEISGPLRVGGEMVRDTLGGAEVGLKLVRQQDFQTYEWKFRGGKENYSLRVPEGSYQLDFVIYENAMDGVAWGNAPMGLKLNVAQSGEPFMNFLR